MMPDAMSEQRRNTDATQRDSDETIDRLSIAEAAEHLGLSVDAVRMRVRRGTLSSDEVDGKKVVLIARRDQAAVRLGIDETETRHAAESGERRRDDGELIEHLRSEVAYLRQTLDAEIESRRRADHLVAGMIEERRGLMAQIAALTAGESEHQSERRRDDDETMTNALTNALDAAAAQNTAPLRDGTAEKASDPLGDPLWLPKPSQDTLALRWRRWWRRVMGG
jgi:hypothetical protein